jgi:hypothetical protein
MLSMTTLTARRSTGLDFVREFFAFVRTMIVANSSGDESSTGFSWPRGL